MNIFRNTKWTLQARKKQITRAKRHKLRLHLERLDTRVQASSSLLGAVWGMLIADAFGRDSEENPLALSNFLQNEAAKIASESSIAAQVAAPDIQPNRVTSSQPSDSEPTQRALKQTVTTDVPLSDQSESLAENAPSLASSLKLLDAGVPLETHTQDPPTAAEVDFAMTPPSNAGGAGSGSSGGPGMPRVGSVADAPAGAAFSATAPAVPGASGGGGPSVTLSDDVPEVQGSAEGEETVATDSAFLATGSATDAGEDETLLGPDAETVDSGTMSFTGCGCGTPPCVTRENWCPMCGGSHCENLLSEVFLDFYDDNSYYDNNAHDDDATSIRLPHFFADNDQAACTLGYSVQSNSDPSLIGTNISTNCAGIPFLHLEALDSPGIADVVVRGTDGDGMYADWGIKVYAVEVTGFEVEERAWAEAQWDEPEDSDQCGASDATWNVLWGADSHRWTPIVAPPAAHDRVVTHGFGNDTGEFAHADWCQAPPSADYGAWDRWAYGTPNAQGETEINPLVTFSALDVDALLSDNAYVRIKTAPEPEDAPQISLHTISAQYHDGLEWEPVSPAQTKEVPALCQDLSFAELTDTTDRPYWAVFPTTGTVDYDVVEVKVRITPAIPAGRKGDVHLAWYDPLNTIANVSSTPPTTNSANTVRDNHQDATLTPLTGTTVTFTENMDEESAYYRINTPRFGDNYIVAAHPHNGFETGYYFDGCGCGCGSTEEFLHYDDYPEGTNCGVNPGHPDFTAPLVDALLTPNKQTPTLNILPSVDIDTDSDNDGVVEPDNETEDAMEDDDVQMLGKRILKNTDDDNDDGIPDVYNLQHTDYKSQDATDDDFAEIRLRLTGGDVADLDGYELWLAEPNGLSLYASEDKKWIVPDPYDPDDDGLRDYDIPTKEDTSGGGAWYKWTLGPGADFADTVYAEGKAPGIHDVFWRVVDPATGNILARDTVNIIVVDVLILDDGKIPTDELKVAKWQDGYTGSPPTVKPDFIDFDPDRFYTRVVDVSKNTDALTKQTITIELATDSPGDDYDDDSTEIELVEVGVDAGIFESKSLMLMADDVDDDHPVDNVEDDEPNDRTHKIALDGKVKIRYPAMAASVAATATVEKVKTVTVKVVILTVGGTPAVSTAHANNMWTIVRERYAQVGVHIDWTVSTLDPPAGVNLSDGLLVRAASADRVLADEAKNLIEGRGTKGDLSDIHVFYVNQVKIGGGTAFGSAVADYWYDESEEDYLYNAFINNSLNKPFNAPHELAHLLVDGPHVSDEVNVLYATTSTSNIVEGTKRLRPDQETAIQASPLAQ